MFTFKVLLAAAIMLEGTAAFLAAAPNSRRACPWNEARIVRRSSSASSKGATGLSCKTIAVFGSTGGVGLGENTFPAL
jgi:hypothetical protein